MKKLYLIRHAKSDWSNPFLDDFDRTLSERGKKNAPSMGKLLKSKNIHPDLIISSPAKRAKKTANKIAREVNYINKIYFNEEIYEASHKTLLKIIRKIPNEHDIVFLVAHNPSLNMLASYLIDFSHNISTCGIVEINFEIDSWKNLEKINSEFKSYDYPKKYEI